MDLPDLEYRFSSKEDNGIDRFFENMLDSAIPSFRILNGHAQHPRLAVAGEGIAGAGGFLIFWLSPISRL